MNRETLPTVETPEQAWWRPVWICLAGEQPLPNVLPLLTRLPETVVFLHTDMKASIESAKRCARFMAAKGVKTMTHKTSAFSPKQVAEDVVTIAARHDLSRVLLNYTGGTKLMSLAAHNALPPHIPKVYFDSRMGIMADQNAFVAAEPPALTVEEMLSLHADVTIDLTAEAPHGSETSSALLAGLLAVDGRNLTSMLSFRQKYLKPLRTGRNWRRLTDPIKNPFEDKNPDTARGLEAAMRKDGLLEEREGFCPNSHGLTFLEGLWWEQVVAARVKEGFRENGIDAASLDLKTNLTIRWTRANIVTQNEFDLAFVFRNRLYLISCTSASESETEKRRVQIEAFTDRLGGHFGKAMIASTLGGALIDKLRARGSDRVFVPAVGHWQDPAGLIRKWCL